MKTISTFSFAAVLALIPLTVSSAGAKKASEEAATPDDKVAKAFGGKVWISPESIRAVDGPELRDWLSSTPAAPTVERKTKDGPWTISFRAVFKKPSAKGPITVQFFEKGDPKALVDEYSPPNEESTVVFIDTHDLEPDHGFNKERSYVMKVGQILKGKFVAYATGEVTLK
jgi:hypothetical protein